MSFTQRNDGPTTGCVAWPGLYVESPADRFVEAMEEANDRDRLILASRAIRHDPGSIEARLVLAEYSEDKETLFRHLEKAVETGKQLWTPVAKKLGKEMTWWGFSGTRPYMRAIAALGRAHRAIGNEPAARECFNRLLEMNPHDNQGIRYLVEEIAAKAAGPGMR